MGFSTSKGNFKLVDHGLLKINRLQCLRAVHNLTILVKNIFCHGFLVPLSAGFEGPIDLRSFKQRVSNFTYRTRATNSRS